jgi:hypothetical protein
MLASPFKVILSHGSDVENMKEVIKKKMENKLKDVDYPELTVWKLDKLVSCGDAEKEGFLASVTYAMEENQNLIENRRCCRKVAGDAMLHDLVSIAPGHRPYVWFLVRRPPSESYLLYAVVLLTCILCMCACGASS